MANAPSHANNPASDQVTIFNANGDTVVMSRLNAVDLVRIGTHFWKSQDIHVERPEADGPADPTAKVVTIYNAEGTPFKVDSANARDMINMGNYFWNDPKSVAETTTDTETTAVAETTTDTETTAVEEASSEEDETTEPETTDVEEDAGEESEEAPEQESLEAEALRVSGSDDVVVYLEGFSEESLRSMAQERFGEKVHHRASKTNVIAKIVEFEEARLVGDDQADA